MHAKVGASPAYLLSQLTTAVAGAACFVASVLVGGQVINSAKTAFFKPSLVISAQDLAWTGAMKFRLDHDRQFAPSVVAPDLNMLVTTNVSAELAKIARLESHAKYERRLLFKHFSSAHKQARRRVARAHVDVVHLSAAAPQIQAGPSPMTEAQKFQQIHRILESHFVIAMRDATPTDLTIQSVIAVNTQSDRTKTEPPKKAPAALLVAAKRRKHHKARALSRELSKAPIVEARQDFNQRDSIVSSQAAEDEAFNRMVDQAAGYQDFQAPPAHEGVRPIQVTETEREATPGTGGSTHVSPIQVSTTSALPAPAPEKTVAPPSQDAVSIRGQQWIFPAALPTEYPKARVASQPPVAPYNPAGSNGGGYSRGIQGASVAMNTQSTHSSAPTPIAVAPSQNNLLDAVPAEKTLLASRLKESILAASFVEAFEWNTAVSDAQAEILTREDPMQPYGESQKGWRIARASNHWPTVFWNQGGKTPLLSKTTAKILSLKIGATLQADAGIVIAKVPAGWSLELSARAERPVIYTDTSVGSVAGSGQFLVNDNPSEERYYVFMNVSPGAQILYLVRSGETGALALPVFGGMVSYADLSQPESRRLTGKVLDAGGADARGMSAMQVQVVGSGQSTVTNGAGYFRIDDVVAFGNAPIFLEVSSNRGYPHRYEINPTQRRFSLFYMSEDEVHDWIGQLDGGVSADSGLIVAALPNVSAANESNKPIPEIRTLAEDPTLTPETYTLSPSGQLLVKTPVSSENTRVLGVQVPEGPALVELKDKENRVIWSELLVVSPRVLSVVGPY